MAKNLRAPGTNHPKGEQSGAYKHGIRKFQNLNWNDEQQIDDIVIVGLTDEELARLKTYLYTLANDPTLTLTPFEMKRIALGMIVLERGDKYFLNRDSDNLLENVTEVHKFLNAKEQMILNTLQKARTETKSRPQSLWDQLDDPGLKNITIKAEGVVDGIEYTFEKKSKKSDKPKMLKVVVDEKESKEDSEEEDKE